MAHLRGEFALSLYDEKKQRLVVARDRFGIKPVCYAVQDGQLLVASEAKALFAMGLEASFDSESVFHTLNMQYTLPDRTLFSGVKQLPPGHFLLAQDGQIRIEKYFDLDYPELESGAGAANGAGAVSYTHLTLPTKRIV